MSSADKAIPAELIGTAVRALAQSLQAPSREIESIPRKFGSLFSQGRLIELAFATLRQDPVPVIKFWDDALDIPLGPIQSLGNSLANLPARIGLQLVLQMTPGELFPDVPKSKVVTLRDSAAQAVYQIANAGVASRTASFKTTTNVGTVAFIAMSGGGRFTRAVALVGGKVLQFLKLTIKSRLKAVLALAVDVILRSLFAMACLAVVIGLIANQKQFASTFALRQNKRRRWVSGAHRTREQLSQ